MQFSTIKHTFTIEGSIVILHPTRTREHLEILNLLIKLTLSILKLLQALFFTHKLFVLLCQSLPFDLKAEMQSIDVAIFLTH